MTVLERLLGHDAWTTRQLLLRCTELSEEQMSRSFDFSGKDLRETLHHLIAVMESHTDFLLMRTVSEPSRADKSVEGMLKRLTIVSQDLADFALRVEREGREDELITNPRNGNRRTCGGVIAHILTHGMHHRAQILFMLDQLGVPEVLEGDVLGWEATLRGWGWEQGGSYGKMIAG